MSAFQNGCGTCGGGKGASTKPVKPRRDSDLVGFASSDVPAQARRRAACIMGRAGKAVSAGDFATYSESLIQAQWLGNLAYAAEICGNPNTQAGLLQAIKRETSGDENCKPPCADGSADAFVIGCADGDFGIDYMTINVNDCNIFTVYEPTA